MSNLALALDKLVGWRNAIRAICIFSWAIAAPMFLLKEPVRNATNEEAKRMKAKELLDLNQQASNLSHDDKPLLN